VWCSGGVCGWVIDEVSSIEQVWGVRFEFSEETGKRGVRYDTRSVVMTIMYSNISKPKKDWRFGPVNLGGAVRSNMDTLKFMINVC